MSPMTLKSEKYLNQKWKSEIKMYEKIQTRESLTSFFQFLLAVGVILLIVNFPESFKDVVLFAQTWVQQLIG